MSNSIPTLVDHQTFEEIIYPALTAIPKNGILVELGSYLGGSIVRICDKLNELNKMESTAVYAIDDWRFNNISKETTAWIKECHKEWFRSPDDNLNYKHLNFLENITKAGYLDKIIPLKKDSVLAAQCFNDNTIDFLFVDDDHSYPKTKQVLEAWLPKIKLGGFITGHDYSCDGVKLAVQEVLGENIVVSSIQSSYRFEKV